MSKFTAQILDDLRVSAHVARTTQAALQDDLELTDYSAIQHGGVDTLARRVERIRDAQTRMMTMASVAVTVGISEDDVALATGGDAMAFWERFDAHRAGDVCPSV